MIVISLPGPGIGGRTIPVDSNLSSVPTYHMSMFLLPKTVNGNMDKARRTFFWQGGVRKENIT
jgi:hypothetical protein